MATKLDLADAQFIGYNHGKYQDLLGMIESMGLKRSEWQRWKKKYTSFFLQREIDEIDYYFNQQKQ